MNKKQLNPILLFYSHEATQSPTVSRPINTQFASSNPFISLHFSLHNKTYPSTSLTDNPKSQPATKMNSHPNHSEPRPDTEDEVPHTKLRAQAQNMERKAKTAMKMLKELTEAGVKVPVGGIEYFDGTWELYSSEYLDHFFKAPEPVADASTANDSESTEHLDHFFTAPESAGDASFADDSESSDASDDSQEDEQGAVVDDRDSGSSDGSEGVDEQQRYVPDLPPSACHFPNLILT